MVKWTPGGSRLMIAISPFSLLKRKALAMKPLSFVINTVSDMSPSPMLKKVDEISENDDDNILIDGQDEVDRKLAEFTQQIEPDDKKLTEQNFYKKKYLFF